MKLTKETLKQLIKEEIEAVMGEQELLLKEGTMEELIFPKFKFFFEDSPQSMLNAFTNASKAHLKDFAKYDYYKKGDEALINRKFFPLYIEAMKSSWKAYPKNRKEIDDKEEKTSRNQAGEVTMTRFTHPVKSQFEKKLRELSNASPVRIAGDKQSAYDYFYRLIDHIMKKG